MDALKNGKMQLALGGKSPGQGKKAEGAPSFGVSKGGKGAGFGSTANVPEKNAMKLSKLPPSARTAGKRGTEKNAGATLMFKGEPDRNARSATPYYEARTSRTPVRESSVNTEDIPASYRKQVKEYFESIKP